jgi:hypothetical protein
MCEENASGLEYGELSLWAPTQAWANARLLARAFMSWAWSANVYQCSAYCLCCECRCCVAAVWWLLCCMCKGTVGVAAVMLPFFSMMLALLDESLRNANLADQSHNPAAEKIPSVTNSRACLGCMRQQDRHALRINVHAVQLHCLRPIHSGQNWMLLSTSGHVIFAQTGSWRQHDLMCR